MQREYILGKIFEDSLNKCELLISFDILNISLYLLCILFCSFFVHVNQMP